MPIQTWLSVATLISAAVALISVYVTVRNHQRELTTHVALEFSARLRIVLSSIPVDMWRARLSGWRELPEKSLELRIQVALTHYQFLEMYDFQRKKLLPAAVWNLWKADIESALQNPIFTREWPVLRAQFENHPHYCRYIDLLNADR